MFDVVRFDRTFRHLMEDGVGISADVREDSENYEILADVPGVDRKDIDISLENSVLSISAKREKVNSRQKVIFEKRWSGFTNLSYQLNFPVEEKDISAELNYGVLKIKIPKARSKLRKIEIN